MIRDGYSNKMTEILDYLDTTTAEEWCDRFILTGLNESDFKLLAQANGLIYTQGFILGLMTGMTLHDSV